MNYARKLSIFTHIRHIMKLHLPQGLRRALLVCISGLSAVGTTVSTGAIAAGTIVATLAGQALAEDETTGDDTTTTETTYKELPEIDSEKKVSLEAGVNYNLEGATTNTILFFLGGTTTTDHGLYVAAENTITVARVDAASGNNDESYTKLGDGTLILTGAPQWARPDSLTVADGTLVIQYRASWGGGFVSDTATVSAGATLKLDHQDALGVTVDGTRGVNNLILNGTVGGAAATLDVAAGTTLWHTLQLNGNAQVISSTGTSGTAGYLVTNGGSSKILVSGTGNTIATNMKLNGALEISAEENTTGALTMSGVFSGNNAVTVNSGVSLTTTAASSSIATLTLNSGANLTNTGSLTITTFNHKGNVNFLTNSPGMTVTNWVSEASSSLTLGGGADGTGYYTFSSDGSYMPSNYLGKVTIACGRLELNNNQNYSNVVVKSGSTLNFLTADKTLTGNVSITGKGHEVNKYGALVFETSGTVDGTVTVEADGAQLITWNGSKGTVKNLNLLGDLDFNGRTTANGSLDVTGAMSGTGTLVVNAGTLNIASTATSAVGDGVSLNITSNGSLTSAGNLTLAGTSTAKKTHQFYGAVSINDGKGTLFVENAEVKFGSSQSSENKLSASNITLNKGGQFTVNHKGHETNYINTGITLNGGTFKVDDLDTTALKLGTLQVDAASEINYNWGGDLSFTSLSGKGDLNITGGNGSEGDYHELSIHSLTDYSGSLTISGNLWNAASNSHYKVYINGITQTGTNSGSVLNSGRTYSADGFVKAGSGSFSLGTHTAEGSFTVESGALSVGTLSATGDVTLSGGKLLIGTGGMTAGAGLTLSGGTLAAASELVLAQDMTVGGVTLGGESGYTGAITLGGESTTMTVSGTLINNGALTLAGTITAAEGASFDKLSSADSKLYSNGVNGYLGNSTLLVKEGSATGTKSVSVAEGTTINGHELKVTGGNAYYFERLEEGADNYSTYYITKDDSYDSNTMADATKFAISDEAVFTTSKNWSTALVLSNGKFTLNNESFGSVTSVELETAEGEENSANVMNAYSSSMRVNVTGTGDLTINLNSTDQYQVLYLRNSELSFDGDLTLSSNSSTYGVEVGAGEATTIKNTGDVTFSDASGHTLQNGSSLENGGDVIIASGAGLTVQNGTIQNEGNVEVSGKLTLEASSNAKIALSADADGNGGVVEVKSSGELVVSSGASFSASELLVSGGSVTANNALTLDKVTVNGGTVYLSGLSNTSTVSVAAGAAIELARGAVVDVDNFYLAGGAELKLNSAALSFTAQEVGQTQTTIYLNSLVGAIATIDELTESTTPQYSFAAIDLSSLNLSADAIVGTTLFSNAQVVDTLAGADSTKTPEVWVTYDSEGNGNFHYLTNVMSDGIASVVIGNAVPEPTTATLSLLALAALAARRRRR